MTRVRVHLEAEPVALRIARKQAAAAAAVVGASAYDARRIELAVGEALTNAYRHAYGGASGPVEVEITHDEDRLVVSVHDEGKGPPFGPGFPEPPHPRTGNGYGLHVIKQIVDEAHIQQPGVKGRGTSVHMVVKLR